MFREIKLVLLASVVAALTACGDGSIVSVSEGMTVEKLAGDSQSATVNAAVAVQPSLRVATKDGEPIPGVAVTFEVGEGGGSV